MRQLTYTVAANRPLTAAVYELTLTGDTADFTRPGQFAELKIDGLFLRRPISICEVKPDALTLIYKVVGAGSAALAALPAGATLDLLTGLGNGFSLPDGVQKPLIVGGGVGVPPLYGLVKTLLAAGKQPTVILGFNTKREAFYVDEFAALCPVTVTTADGSLGKRGFVTDALDAIDSDYFCACGPLPMLKALCAAAKTPGQVSLEERMGCGFGACMGCTVLTKDGPKRVCREGPVFTKEVLLW